MIGLISSPHEAVPARLRDTLDAVGRVVPMHRIEAIRNLEKLSLLVVVEPSVDRSRAAVVGRRVSSLRPRPRLVWFTRCNPANLSSVPLPEIDRLIDLDWRVNGLSGRLARAHRGDGSRDRAVQALRRNPDLDGQPLRLLAYMLARIPPARTIEEIAGDFGVSKGAPRKAWARAGIQGPSLKVFLNWLQLADLQEVLRDRAGVERAARLYEVSPRTLQRISERLIQVPPSDLASVEFEVWDRVSEFVDSPRRKMGGGGNG